jgi:hypothetical protein
VGVVPAELVAPVAELVRDAKADPDGSPEADAEDVAELVADAELVSEPEGVAVAVVDSVVVGDPDGDLVEEDDRELERVAAVEAVPDAGADPVELMVEEELVDEEAEDDDEAVDVSSDETDEVAVASPEREPVGEGELEPERALLADEDAEREFDPEAEAVGEERCSGSTRTLARRAMLRDWRSPWPCGRAMPMRMQWRMRWS